MKIAAASIAVLLATSTAWAAGFEARPDSLHTVDRNRGSLVKRIVDEWALPATAADPTLTREAFAEALWQLRADRLLAASLAGDVDTVLGLAAPKRAETAPGDALNREIVQKALGDANADLTYTPINPCRIVDTRNAGGPLITNVTRTFNGFAASFASQGGTATSCGMPNGVTAIAMNVVAVNPTNLGFIKLWPAGAAEPFVSTINYEFGLTAIATGTIVPVDTANNNRFNARSPAQVDFVADVVGYFRAPANIHISGDSNNPNVVVGSATNSAAAGEIGQTISGGGGNVVSASFATISGGTNNEAGGAQASIGGGDFNAAHGAYSTIPGGAANFAGGDFSFAAGYSAWATQPGMFVWSDSLDFVFDPGALRVLADNGANTFNVRATGEGGVWLVTGVDGEGLPVWGCQTQNGSGWSCTSDRNAKRNLEPMDGPDVLSKLAVMPIYRWQPKDGPHADVTHAGPMAQDFHAAFGLGNNDRMIGSQDADGIALAAIQGLNAKLEAGNAETAALRQELRVLRRAVETLMGPTHSDR